MPRRTAPGTSVALDDALDALFQGAPDEFIPARDALAKQLRSDGRRDDAARVKSLRRPSVAAWAVNQAARRRRNDVARLGALGDELRRAQDEAVARGRRSDRLRDLGAQRRALVASLADAAFDILRDRGVASESHRDDIVATFEAVAADPQAAAKVQAGRLSRALDPPIGFGSADGVVVSIDDDGTKRPPSAKPLKGAGGSRGRRVHVLDAAEVRKARARAARAAEALETAEREVARLEKALTTARQEAAKARDAAARAEAAADAAEAAANRSG